MKRIILTASFACSCASTVVIKDFSPANAKPEEGIVAGRIKINYNGFEHTQHCAFAIDNGTNFVIKLSQDGWILAKIPAGPAKVYRIACDDNGSGYFYEFKNVALTIKPYPEKTYIGDMEVEWKTKGGMKAAVAFGVIGALADQSSSDGKMQVAVKNNKAQAQAEYLKKFPEDKSGTFAESIVDFAELAAAK